MILGGIKLMIKTNHLNSTPYKPDTHISLYTIASCPQYAHGHLVTLSTLGKLLKLNTTVMESINTLKVQSLLSSCKIKHKKATAFELAMAQNTDSCSTAEEPGCRREQSHKSKPRACKADAKS